jgi:hypothetical protein
LGGIIHKLEHQLKKELNLGERLLWQGTPKPGIIFRGADIFLIPFSTIWFGGALFWEGSVLLAWAFQNSSMDEGVSETIGFFALFGIPFVIVGLYFFAGRFWHDKWRRRNTLYGLTNDRAIIISRAGIKSFPISANAEINVKHHKNGRSTISFGPEASSFSVSMSNQSGAWTGAPSSPTFESVSEGLSVYKKVKSIISGGNQ